MKYQLVFQWPASSLQNYDQLIEVEDRLLEIWGDKNEIDGHDLGDGEANIFIVTDNPTLAFEKARELLGTDILWKDVRVAYREISGNTYKIVWPIGLNTFTVA